MATTANLNGWIFKHFDLCYRGYGYKTSYSSSYGGSTGGSGGGVSGSYGINGLLPELSLSLGGGSSGKTGYSSSSSYGSNTGYGGNTGYGFKT